MAASNSRDDPKQNGRYDDTLTDVSSNEELLATIPKGSMDPVYEAKALLLNKAILDIGMGWYQWQLFIVIGFGWASDNMWPVITSLIFTPVKNEFMPSKAPLLTLAQNLGLLVGAVFWGFGCDVYGRKWAFNLTIGITAVFGLAAAGSPSFAAIGAFAALWSIGVGGNLPVDSAIFLEFLPSTHQYLLTILSIDWALAQVLANLIAWPLLGNYSCQEHSECTRSANMGWRYFLIAMGGYHLSCLFTLHLLHYLRVPEYLMGKASMKKQRGGKVSTLTIDDLARIGPPIKSMPKLQCGHLKKFDFEHVRALFGSPLLAFSTSVIIGVWAFIGLGFPLYNAFLPFIQASRGADFGDSSTYITYRNSLIIAALGIPGSLIGGILNCAYNFMSNIMYAVLYAYTPEIFPTKDRGTGNALTAAANRIFGVMAPIIAMFANLQTAAPVYVSGALFIAAGILVMFQPFESRGKASL
ncbi:hypothetical protein MGYG_07118 [Nannizzia gypsea CBS 118893]|uniref:Major facilitator superfamily (MFS) profile domain-containing protein n=1 Tax=Arthroderma gypseum (strain ATCC MYA-4604 / CBS 118893) TaxID=535722 RepID=E4V246_ARTGP|nr:hypothetical protein MGYG_07118 [Nannizzia gypsea CBS 118893]EFR04111.1 hypothetical protein MGYG_07118 [Nannizzia gypsea CBS 118893]